MRIFAAGLATETNTFSPVPTGIEDFLVERGRDVAQGRVSNPSLDLTRVWGMQARARGDEFVFSLNAWAEPAGITTRVVYESLRDELLRDLKRAAPVDVVLLMLHGAMVAEGYEDCEQDLIGWARSIVGPDAVIAVEFDLHCHLTPEKIAAANLVVTYKEYPHTDIQERARELFDLAVATRLQTIKPTMALFDCAMVGFYPTTRQPLRGLVDEMMEAERSRRALSISFAHSFPYADLQHTGAKMLVVTDDDHARARQLAREFGMKVYAVRRDIGFDSVSLPMDVALPRALASVRRPVVVADQSDNVGGGGPGDATFVLQWLLEHSAEDVAMAILYDPEVVKTAKRAGLGSRLCVRLGGKLGPTSGEPIDLDVTVVALLADYMHVRPQQSGEPLLSPLGDVACLRHGSIDIVVSSRRCQCYCPSIFKDIGVNPASKRVLIVKSAQHFYSAFAPIASDVIYMAAPGAVPPDPKRIPYRTLQTSRLYPWNERSIEGS
jgi:microcystin degradation protein MlrC